MTQTPGSADSTQAACITAYGTISGGEGTRCLVSETLSSSDIISIYASLHANTHTQRELSAHSDIINIYILPDPESHSQALYVTNIYRKNNFIYL